VRVGEGAVEVVNITHILFVGLASDIEEGVAVCLGLGVVRIDEIGGWKDLP
jgi:hypothetical protein